MVAPVVNVIVYMTCLLVLGCSSVKARCTLGANVGAANLFLGTGQYIDWTHPLECSGNLTTWNFCYYREDITQDGVYRVYFRIWRPENESMPTLTRIYNRETLIQINQDDVASPFMCDTIALAMDEYIEVQERDVLGVYIPVFQSRTLHIVGNDTNGFGLYIDQRGIVASFNERTITLNDVIFGESLGLHLSADIVTNSVAPESISVSSVKPSSVNPSTVQPSSRISTGTPANLLPSISRSVVAASLSVSAIESTIVNPALTQSQITYASSADQSSVSAHPSSVHEPLITSISYAESVTSSTSSPFAPIRPVSNTVINSGPAGTDKSSSQLSAGTTAAIVVGGIFLVAITACVLVVTVILVLRKQRRGFVSKMPIEGNSGFYMDNVVYTGAISEFVPPPPPPPDEAENHYEAPMEVSWIEVGHHSNGILSNPQPYEVPMAALISSNTSTEIITSTQSKAGHESEYVEMGSDTDVKKYLSPRSSSASQTERNKKTQSVASTVSGDYTTLDPFSQYYKLLEQASEGVSEQYRAPPSSEEEILTVLDQQGTLSVTRHNIQIDSHIGSGQFGMVEKGTWKSPQGAVDVAVKLLPAMSSQVDKVKFLQEAAIMGQFRHPNVVKLYGVITTGNPVMLMIEYLPKKDLRRRLVKMGRKILTAGAPQKLLTYCQQVALGMHYLASKGFVHRDLAARNVFVSQDNVCKVGDFGMSRDLADADYYVSHGGKIPVRWTAPEAMYFRKYSTASDIWSFGCLLYEIWSLGRMPFKDYTNAQVIQKVDAGYRLSPPAGCPRAIYELMIKCWHPHPPARPGFREILLDLLKDESTVLHIPTSDASTNLHAGNLGASTQAGEYMYTDLQQVYLSPEERSDYDHIPERKYVLSFPTSSADLDYLFDDTSTPSETSRQSYRWTFLTNDRGSDYEDISQ